MRVKGKLSRWDDDKGFGFIRPNITGPDVFLHIKSLRNPSRRPQEGDVITYALVSGKKGLPTAANATLSGDKLKGQQGAKRGKPIFPFAVIAGFGITLLTMQFTGHAPLLLLVGYFALSFITFVTYAFDKASAKKNRRRTPESSLHLLGLLGGWPGAILAQQWLRHKSIKQPFRGIFWLTVLVNISAILYALKVNII